MKFFKDKLEYRIGKMAVEEPQNSSAALIYWRHEQSCFTTADMQSSHKSWVLELYI